MSTSTTTTTSTTTDNNLALSRWEIQILKCIKSKPLTEKKIAKELSLDISVISPLITDLMLRGFVERTRRRRMYFSSREYFAATIEGLSALEANRHKNGSILWNQLISMLKDNSERMLLEFSNKSLPFKVALGVIKTTYTIAKLILK